MKEPIGSTSKNLFSMKYETRYKKEQTKERRKEEVAEQQYLF